jgi:alginate O-acetyltransferase complex protein AlgI
VACGTVPGGAYLAINHLWLGWRSDASQSSVAVPVARALTTLSWAVTFLAVVIAWVFFRAKTVAGAGRMLGGLFGISADSSTYVSPGILRVMDLPVFVGTDQLCLIGTGVVAATLVIALSLPNVPQILRYREYRRAPEQNTYVRWRPNAGWAIFTALALSISLFGMWQRLEFLYFQF